MEKIDLENDISTMNNPIDTRRNNLIESLTTNIVRPNEVQVNHPANKYFYRVIYLNLIGPSL